jgi:predicted RNA binding protein YcfA (HicA-like mRNA interferase family)
MVIRALTRNGWNQVDQEGSHVQLKYQGTGKKVTVPNHVGEILAPKTLKSIADQVGITVAELSDMIQRKKG